MNNQPYDYTYDIEQGWIHEPTNTLATTTENNMMNEILKLNMIINNMANELQTIRYYQHLDTEDIIEQFTDQMHKKDQQ